MVGRLKITNPALTEANELEEATNHVAKPIYMIKNSNEIS